MHEAWNPATVVAIRVIAVLFGGVGTLMIVSAFIDRAWVIAGLGVALVAVAAFFWQLAKEAAARIG